ncbi:MAG: TIR domain-containing protein [Fimbriimonadaceae bacterium]|nr:TIR domain-containing protein [Fimbriimonadaceae bacterium]
MARRAFFSFHYELDVHRASIIRNAPLTHSDTVKSFIDASLWEEAKRKSTDALKKLIMDALQGTSVTVVLIGSRTNDRPWVKYELEQSIARGNGIVGVRINKLKNLDGQVTGKGVNPLDNATVTFKSGSKKPASTHYKTYDYVDDDGYKHLGTWIEEAARLAGK